MATIAECQRVQYAWFAALAAATGGKTFTTHESHWVWLPARRELMLMFPLTISAAGIRPGLAEGARLGASTVGAWLNGGVEGTGLHKFGFETGWQPWWMAAAIDDVLLAEPDEVSLDDDCPEITGPDALELEVARMPTAGAGAGARASAGPEASAYRAWHAAARAGSRLVGHGYAFLPGSTSTSAAIRRSQGELARDRRDQRSQGGAPSTVAGIFNMAVGTAYRRRGYGAGILSAVARAARTAGTRELVLNATPLGEKLYSARGFELLGRGQTYWLHVAR